MSERFVSRSVQGLALGQARDRGGGALDEFDRLLVTDQCQRPLDLAQGVCERGQRAAFGGVAEEVVERLLDLGEAADDLARHLGPCLLLIEFTCRIDGCGAVDRR